MVVAPEKVLRVAWILVLSALATSSATAEPAWSMLQQKELPWPVMVDAAEVLPAAEADAYTHYAEMLQRRYGVTASLFIVDPAGFDAAAPAIRRALEARTESGKTAVLLLGAATSRRAMFFNTPMHEIGTEALQMIELATLDAGRSEETGNPTHIMGDGRRFVESVGRAFDASWSVPEKAMQREVEAGAPPAERGDLVPALWIAAVLLCAVIGLMISFARRNRSPPPVARAFGVSSQAPSQSSRAAEMNTVPPAPAYGVGAPNRLRVTPRVAPPDGVSPHEPESVDQADKNVLVRELILLMERTPVPLRHHLEAAISAVTHSARLDDRNKTSHTGKMRKNCAVRSENCGKKDALPSHVESRQL